MGILISAVGINPREGPGPPFGFTSFKTPTILKVRPTVTAVFDDWLSSAPNGHPKKLGGSSSSGLVLFAGTRNSLLFPIASAGVAKPALYAKSKVTTVSSA